MHGSMIDRERTVIMEQLSDMTLELSQAQAIPELKQIRDHAERLRTDAQQRDIGLDVQNCAAELKLRSERKLGMSLAEMKLRGGDRKSGRDAIRLKDLGIDKNQSARWQQAATVPEADFQHYLQTTQDSEKEISSAALLRLAKEIRINGRRANATYPSGVSDSRPLTHFSPQTESEISNVQSLEVHDLVDEGKNHVNTLSGLLDHLCEQAGLDAEAGERRACQRYLAEISRHFDSVLTEMRHLSRQHRFLLSAVPA